MPGQRGSIKEDSSQAVLTALAVGATGFSGTSTRTWPQYVAAFTATLSALSVGTLFAWTSPALPLLRESKNFAEDELSWVSGIMMIGAFLGALPTGAAADRLGRRMLSLLLSVPLLLSWVLLGFGSRSIWLLIIGRFVGGVASGATTVVIPMYVSEIAHSSVRGTLGSFLQLQITIGILLGYLAGMMPSLGAIALMCSIVPIVYAVTFYNMPETPVYLVSQGRLESARKSILFFRGDTCDLDYEISKITIQVQESRKMKASLSDIVSTRAARRAMIVSIGLMTAQQLSGINAVIFYTNDIFKASHSGIPPEIATIIVGVVQVLATYASTVLVDRAGRRALLIISCSVMSICLATLGVYFFLKDQGHNLLAMSWLPLVAMALFIIVFSLGMGPLPWVLMGEIFPENTKATASAAACASNWMLAFLVTKNFQYVKDALGEGQTFGLFSIICAIGTAFIATIVPETKGKDSSQIQAVLDGRKTVGDDDDDTDEDEVLSRMRRTDKDLEDDDYDPDSARTVVRRMSGLARESEAVDEPTRVVFTI